MPSYKLSYFNARGRAEPSRMLFALADQAYEDVRIEDKDWFTTVKQTTPFGRLPLLEVDGMLLCQSRAFERLLAKTFDRYGATVIEQAHCDMIVDCCEDVLETYFVKAAPDEFEKAPSTNKNPRKQKWLDEILPKDLQRLEAFATPTGFIAGKQLMWCDVKVYCLIEDIESFAQDGEKLDLSAYPKLSAIQALVKQNPKIAAWLAARPKTPM